MELSGLPPLLVEVGECECLRDQVQDFVVRAKAAGVDVEDYLAPGMIHVFPLFTVVAQAGSPPGVRPERPCNPSNLFSC